ncbi:MAG TPA: TetR/AcrR family transcriptional regulator [Dongiaceae bacterium]|nr:TetR/AcrR family transcriptional regulator [Dongiaceae bacterium]
MSKTRTERDEIIPALGEIFREHGFEGASLSVITEKTGLGKGSLYHFFPGGKEEMATAVLAEIDTWFQVNVYQPLRDGDDPKAGIDHMFAAVEDYFRAGRRVCLVGVFALDNTRDRFAAAVKSYFADWAKALTKALSRCGHSPAEARALAEDILGGIQGGLVLARALDDPAVFRRTLKRLRESLG